MAKDMCTNCGKKGHTHQECREETDVLLLLQGERTSPVRLPHPQEERRATEDISFGGIHDGSSKRLRRVVVLERSGGRIVLVEVALNCVENSKFLVNLHVLKENNFESDLILGRDFLNKEKLTLVYKPACEGEKVNLFTCLPYYIEDSLTNNLEQIIETVKTDYNNKVEKQLKDLLFEIENTNILPVKDDYTGIIQPSISSYCARVVPVTKKNGQVRLCVDLRPLNSRIEKQKYPFLLIEDCLLQLGNKEDKIVVYMNDVLIPTETVEQNLEILREVLSILKQYKFKLNYHKCQFLRNTVKFLGYTISENGITLSQRHTEAIKNFIQPRNVLEIQRFLGLTNYFRKFIKDYARKARPLLNLLKKSVEFRFDKNCLEAFELLKSELTTAPVLKLYNPAAETELHTDACSLGLGAILLQKQKDNKWAPVTYFSQVTNEAETKYHSFELEMLAIRSKSPTKYKEGDYVLVRNRIIKLDVNTKLKPNYKGPYLIAKSLGNDRYVVRDIPGHNQGAKPMNTRSPSIQRNR
ncbi:uncharacterized protein [Anoplolepis gracilipes]|uniref:uncharacterized protein n=1 Tax=Anoplolepis gracilipes TaxID=354296 RepID=UPI003B9FC46A